ncbi:hypothetical protein H0I23_08125 [Cellulophaga sp. HaHaR_3_176]|uniref:hypothetical protein n=1 Tax=Cellulophaga sp. HaHaR_3_176 TaxID=1942464 RepID=UPI001C1F3C0B|nr:hypothetical protein [Cellulophaga sp. HaHaR_3_176]QWX85594.1 hypothetical protein H0I23_08125 [Cellulophaga sp. HaHaR_3_176]
MIEKKDLILREIQRLTLLIKELITSVIDIEPEKIDAVVNQIDDVLKVEFNLSLNDISELSNNDLLIKMHQINEVHVDKLILLLFQVIKKSDQASTFNKPELIKKNILLINYLDESSKVFSVDRMHMKSALKQTL